MNLFEEEVYNSLKQKGLRDEPYMVNKIVQLYEATESHQSVILCGETGSGKTVIWKTLQLVLENLKEQNIGNFDTFKEYLLNPKVLTPNELFGEIDEKTGKWTDGIVSWLMRISNTDKSEQWIIFDGPIDGLWIECMNSVMDDNKILTLINGEHIILQSHIYLLFEVDNLQYASPSIVSRCGVIYTEYKNVGWKPYVNSWLNKYKDKEIFEYLNQMFDNFVQKILNFKKEKNCEELFPVTELNGVISLCKLLDCLIIEYFQRNPLNSPPEALLKYWFLFCTIWSVCASVDAAGRNKISIFIHGLENSYPTGNTVYEYFVDTHTISLKHWTTKLLDDWKYNSSVPFYNIVVPTVDILQYSYLISTLIKNKHPVLLTGPDGSGKTLIMKNVFSELNSIEYNTFTINLSAHTKVHRIQRIIEKRVQKMTKEIYIPHDGKKLAAFIDDLNLPLKDVCGSQPPLELLRMLMTLGFWYDHKSLRKKFIQELLIVAAMKPLPGEQNTISKRLQQLFFLINVTMPQKTEIVHIFGSMLTQKLLTDFKMLGNTVIQGTIDIYEETIISLHTSPSNAHYIFSLRDIARVVEGFLNVNKDYLDNIQSIVRLWIHECLRVFADRLISEHDKEQFFNILNNKLGLYFNQSLGYICPGRKFPIFSNFMNTSGIYTEVEDFDVLSKFISHSLEQYNSVKYTVPMHLTLFQDAIQHICRISRVLCHPGGNILLLGASATGKKSLSKVSAHICNYLTFQINSYKKYTEDDFHKDLKTLFKDTITQEKSTVFLFDETQIIEEHFLENINDILCNGTISDLFTFEEEGKIFSELKQNTSFEKSNSKDFVHTYLADIMKLKLHVVMCMTSVSNKFRKRIRNYPSIISSCTIDWFTDWPSDALTAIAMKDITNVDIKISQDVSMQQNLANLFSLIHESVRECSQKMSSEIRRYTYVTPSTFLLMLTTYTSLLSQKQQELFEEINKLSSGLQKIDECTSQVEEMTTDLNNTKEKVNKFLAECQKYRINLIQEKTAANEQQKLIEKNSARIQEEEKNCKKMRDVAFKDLNNALPALTEAQESLEKLERKDIVEIRSYASPPHLVEKVVEAVMIFKSLEPTWNEAKKHIGKLTFFSELKQFNPEDVTHKMLKKIENYVSQPDFHPDSVGKGFFAAKSLCMWVRAMENYSRIYKIVEPKIKKVKAAEAALAANEKALAEAKYNLEQLIIKIDNLTKEYEQKVIQKEQLELQGKELENKLEKASLLVQGLATERIRWDTNIRDLKGGVKFLLGDTLIASAFLSYLGPYLLEYRNHLIASWIKQMHYYNLSCSPDFKLSQFTESATIIREWSMQELPSDQFSIDNAIIITTCSLKWPFIIDPQEQALKWIENLEKNKELKILDPCQKDMLTVLEDAIETGKPVLLKNVDKNVDPFLESLMYKTVIQCDDGILLHFPHKNINLNPNFKMYITTKYGNPNLTPKMFSRMTIVNFALQERGLEDQLLEIVVKKECPQLQDQKKQLRFDISNGKQKLLELDEKILQLLRTAEGELLTEALQDAKHTAEEITNQVEANEKAAERNDVSQEVYRHTAQRSSILFFVLNEMNLVSPVYQFSLASYIDLFILSIEKSQRDKNLKSRLQKLDDYHTYAVYRYACRVLFENHKLLFSFHLCVKLMESTGNINKDEYNFFLNGGIVTDRKKQVINPCPKWLTKTSWDNISELDNLSNFHGIVSSFEQISEQWYTWFKTATPDNIRMPGDWEHSCSKFQRMLIVRCLRSDRVIPCVSDFISSNIGDRFIESPPFDITSAIEDSSCKTPLIFILSSNVDPMNVFLQQVEAYHTKHHYQVMSMGQRENSVVKKLIYEGIRKGEWIFLNNCHHNLKWMNELNVIIEELKTINAHQLFRLWLSVEPHPEFPQSILQKCIKITIEQPKGIRNNMIRLYSKFSEQQLIKSEHIQAKYSALLFSLTFFHSVIVQRQQFKNIGWNVKYEFSDSDFEAAENLMTTYIEEQEKIEWDALKFLIGQITYGGHELDEWDKRIISVYLNQFFCQALLKEANYKLTDLPFYHIPAIGNLATYMEHLSFMPMIESPEVFGIHPNAALCVQIQDAQMLFDNLLLIQPRVIDIPEDKEQKALEICNDIMSKLPNRIHEDITSKLKEKDVSHMDIALMHEIENYNNLLHIIKSSLQNVKDGLNGKHLFSEELEEVFDYICIGEVPKLWKKIYPSLKKLGSWIDELIKRINHFDQWGTTSHPPIKFWISAFTLPKMFLTSVLQGYSKANKTFVYNLTWDFVVSTQEEGHIIELPEEGIYVTGLFLEGAAWNRQNSCLLESEPMKFIYQFPVINFKPTKRKEEKEEGLYTCPCYYYSDRKGTPEFPSFIIAIDIKSGKMSSEHWIKRGTAFLMNLDT